MLVLGRLAAVPCSAISELLTPASGPLAAADCFTRPGARDAIAGVETEPALAEALEVVLVVAAVLAVVAARRWFFFPMALRVLPAAVEIDRVTNLLSRGGSPSGVDVAAHAHMRVCCAILLLPQNAKCEVWLKSLEGGASAVSFPRSVEGLEFLGKIYGRVFVIRRCRNVSEALCWHL